MRLSRVGVVPGSASSSAGATGNVTSPARGVPVAATAADCLTTSGAMVDPHGREAADFVDLRSRLLGIAYQILGRVADAEDVVQEVWIRWQRADRAEVRDRVAFLVTITTRVALNAATSAHARREISAGGWLSERDLTLVDPALEAERTEDLEFAVQLLTQQLPPVELAVFVLREAFGYPFGEIAEVLGRTEANARQLARRARIRLAEQRHNPVDPVERETLLEAFLDATRTGDMACLIDLLANLAITRSGLDGGGRPRHHQHPPQRRIQSRAPTAGRPPQSGQFGLGSLESCTTPGSSCPGETRRRRARRV